MPTWEVILAALIWLQSPGKSMHSMVTTAEGGPTAVIAEVNGVKAYRLLQPDEPQPIACQGKIRVACEPPRERQVMYNLRVIRTEWQRPETYDEGAVRYATIAKAIAAEIADRERRFAPGRLWKYLATIAFHESGLRRDVHLGLGGWAIGDCAWRRVKDPRVKVRVPGTCRSHGLFQGLFRDPYRSTLFGWSAREITGLDMASTKRATTVAARHLDRLWAGCTANGRQAAQPSCVFAAYGGVLSAEDKRIRARAGTFARLGGAPAKLDRYVGSLVGAVGEAVAVR